MWKLNNMLQTNKPKKRVNEEIKEDIRKYLETNENKDTTSQNLWNEAKEVLRRKFIAMQAYLKKQEKAQISNLNVKKNKQPKVRRK